MTDDPEAVAACHPAIQEYRKCLVVPSAHVKTIKTALERHRQLDKTVKIVQSAAISAGLDGSQRKGQEMHMVIPTTIRFTQFKGDDYEFFKRFMAQDNRLGGVVEELNLRDLIESGDISIIDAPLNTHDVPAMRNPLLKALEAGLRKLPQELLTSLDLDIGVLLGAFPSTYSIYQPMLLLPSHALNSPGWQKLLTSCDLEGPELQGIWQHLAEATKTTHVAINASIPLKNTSQFTSGTVPDENILRSPANLTPLYGSFGPPPTAQLLSKPTEKDFSESFWVSCTQNGIHQTWAPRYTMFSRGNIKEKARLLNLPSVQDKGKGEYSAADLYAGIGYFAFSYKRAGASKVMCWELNPWSIEGLRRGAKMNGWTVQISDAGAWDAPDWIDSVQDSDFLVFHESNEKALAPVHLLSWNVSKPLIPPIRHVNCGFLPSSKQSWKTAARILDTQLNGWVHVHENIGVDDVEKQTEEVVEDLQYKVNYWMAERGWCGSYRRRVMCEHVECVKTYAPGVIHVVFDMKVDGMEDAEFLL